MKTALVLAIVLIFSLPAVGQEENLGRSSDAGTKRGLTEVGRKGKLEVIPRSIIVERIRTEGSATFPSKVVLFDYGSSRLRDSSHRQLLEIAAALRDPALSKVPFFYIDGHTCSVGTDERNCRLSWRRAMSVINFLVSAGDVPHERLVPRGFGERLPVASNDSEQGREQNRRVAIQRGDSDQGPAREKECH